MTTSAQSTDPTTLPRIEFADIQYVGGFRLPSTAANGDDYSFGGRQLAFNPATNSLFVGSRAGRIAEVTIPGLVNSSNPDALPFASYLQPFADPTEGRLSQIATDGVAVDSLMVYGNRLYGTAFIYYDANNTQRRSHYSHSLKLNEASFQGWSSVWQSDRTGFVSGSMTAVPAEWQAALGGPAITGQCCIPIVTRTSWGPSAFSFDPTRVGDVAVAGTPLLYYTNEHPTLGAWDAANPTYGATISMGGMVAIPGTRTMLYFGAIGTGTNCYGNGTANQSLVGTLAPDGEKYCYDPTNSDKGSHAYPYRYQIWAYDLKDFAAVKAGLKQPWDVLPYGVWPFDLPTQATTVKLGGIGYDAATKTIYLSQLYADKDGYAFRPVIHALHVNAAAAAAPVTTVSSVAVTSNVPAPQNAGATVTFTANATGGVNPVEYKWLTYDGAAWSVRADWSTNSQFTYTATAANANFKVGAWVRSSRSTADAAEASASIDFPINSTRVASVALSANKVSPQAPGTSILWTAAASGGSSPQYKWLLYDGATWSTVREWSADNTYTWTPTVSANNYRVSVWARSGGSTDIYEATNEAYFAISGASTSARVTGVALGSSLPSPQQVNTSITWTASATGGSAPQYKWQLFDGVNWSIARDWSASNTFTWTPTVANANYRVAVWARSGGSTEIYEAVNEAYFVVNAAPVVSRVAGVSLTPSLPSPQLVNTTITWTAAAVGGNAPQYKWWFYDGANWIMVRDWSTSTTYPWTPTAAKTNYRMSVWARSGNSTDVYEATTEVYYSINADIKIDTTPVPAPTTTSRVTSVSLTANLVAPQAPNTTITWTAVPTGGVAPYQFKWEVFDGTTWTSYAWTSSNTFKWTPAFASPNYRVSVWVKSAGNPDNIYEASTERYFAIATK